MTEQTTSHEGSHNPTNAEVLEGKNDIVIEAVRDIADIEASIKDLLHLQSGSAELAQLTDDAIAEIAIREVASPDDSHAAALKAIKTALIETALEVTGERPAATRNPAETLEANGLEAEVDAAVADLHERGAKTPEGQDVAETVAREIEAYHEQAHPEDETIVYNPGKEIQLYNGKKEKRFGIAGELRPLERRDILMPDGSHRPANVIFKIVAAGSPYEFMVAERGGRFAGITTAPDGRTHVTPLGGSDQASFRDGDQYYVAERLDNEKDGISWRFFQGGWARRAVSIVVSDDAEIVERPKIAREKAHESKNRLDRRRRWTRRAVGLAATWATLSSGGFADRLGEGIVDTDKVVVAAERLNLPEPYTMDTELDGIKVRDYPEPQQIIDERNEEISAELAANEQAGVAVGQVLADLDVHDYESIRARAAEYLDSHPGELLDTEEVARLRQAIESATTAEEVMDAANELGGFYGVDFHQLEAGEFDEVQNTVLDSFNALSCMPKTVVERSQLKHINFEHSGSVAMPDGQIGAVQAYYARGDDSLTMYYKGKRSERMMRALTYVPGAAEDYSLENIFFHEFGHALSIKGGVGVSGGAEYVGGNQIASIGVDLVRSGIANYPGAMSTYSRSDFDESRAENVAGVISSRSDGLAHPDELRRFNSPANKQMVRSLIDLEKLRPGLANYFVSVNPRLMQRTVLSFGR